MGVDIDGLDRLEERLDHKQRAVEADAVFEVGTDRDYGVVLEFGRGPITPEDAEALKFEDEDGNTIFRKRVEGHQPYPWFRPAINEFKANPKQFIRENTDFESLDELDTAAELVATVAAALQSKMEDNVNAQDPSRDRSPGTHPDHPKRDTGTLTASISAQRLR